MTIAPKLRGVFRPPLSREEFGGLLGVEAPRERREQISAVACHLLLKLVRIGRSGVRFR
jgi:hypothetical protein